MVELTLLPSAAVTVIFVFPYANAVMIPLELMVATARLEDAHVTAVFVAFGGLMLIETGVPTTPRECTNIIGAMYILATGSTTFIVVVVLTGFPNMFPTVAPKVKLLVGLVGNTKPVSITSTVVLFRWEVTSDA
jgi:hypothetical protein